MSNCCDVCQAAVKRELFEGLGGGNYRVEIELKNFSIWEAIWYRICQSRMPTEHCTLWIFTKVATDVRTPSTQIRIEVWCGKACRGGTQTIAKVLSCQRESNFLTAAVKSFLGVLAALASFKQDLIVAYYCANLIIVVTARKKSKKNQCFATEGFNLPLAQMYEFAILFYIPASYQKIISLRIVTVEITGNNSYFLIILCPPNKKMSLSSVTTASIRPAMFM